MRRIILLRNLYGVDTNPNAIEIAKLRLWLWLATAYEPEHIEPLPNIDYNLRVGNSLIGYIDVNKFREQKLSLFDWADGIETISILLNKKEAAIKDYQNTTGTDARKIKAGIDEIDSKTQRLLNATLYQEINKIIKINENDLKKMKPFHWGFEFPEIFNAKEAEESGFDAIVGNPPYIRIQTLRKDSLAQAEYFRKHYKAASKGNYDIYVLFDERSMAQTNKYGVLGYIQPHKFFQANYGENLRRIITENQLLKEIVNFTDQQVFVGATTYTCLLFLDKEKNQQFNYFQIDKIVNLQNQLESIQISKTKPAKLEMIPATLMTEVPWSFSMGKELSITRKLISIKTNLDTVTERIFQGVRTGMDDVFVLKNAKIGKNKTIGFSKALNTTVEVESELCFPLVKGEQMCRYSISDAKSAIIVPYAVTTEGYSLIKEREIKEKCPLLWVYLGKNKPALENREDGKIAKMGWYGFSRTQNIDIIRKQKIMTADLANQNSFSFDKDGIIHFTSGYGIIPKKGYPEKILLALLNSKLLDWYLRKKSTNFRGGYYSYEYRFIKHLPIIEAENIEKATRERLISLCEEALKGNKKAETKIDEIVYKLYGITDEEQKTIESERNSN